jgi:hypothetical protein
VRRRRAGACPDNAAGAVARALQASAARSYGRAGHTLEVRRVAP